ncbi:MAG: hypothetical protein ACRECD_14885 [Burkholderiaceae bacterium]
MLGLLALAGYPSEGGLRQASVWLHWGLGCAVPLALLGQLLGHVGLERRGR